MYFWYWLVRGDGFDVANWIVTDFLVALTSLDLEYVEMISGLGRMLHRRRFECLVFKKNAGKYVGNFNPRSPYTLTRRSDLIFLAGLGLPSKYARVLFNYVERVLSINESAGEKSIPIAVKQMFPPATGDDVRVQYLLRRVDGFLTQHYDLSEEELEIIIRHDIKPKLELTGEKE